MNTRIDCSKVYVKKIPLKGDSAFAAEDINKGDLVEKGLIRRVETEGNQNPYLFTWSEDRKVWGFGSGCSTFYNTSINPNTKMKRFYQEDRFEIYALSDIKKDEELTHKYQSLSWRTCFNDLNQIVNNTS